MCGICGIFNFRDREPVAPDTVSRMAATIVHRGPDDEGLHVDGPVGLGFRRLAILDLSPAGHQPMSDRSGRVWIVFNGEIYNFRELRQELESEGVTFKSQCDTEVIVEGYVRWGDGVLARLNGMFGLAIWDEPRRRLVVARDAMGIKPVYYAIRDGRLYFGSELRAVFAGLEQRPEVDPIGANLFLRYRYTPAPLTLFKDVRKLAPGERLVGENGAVRVERWYDFRPQPFARMPSAHDAAEQLLEIYKRAMKRHLISDVPVGLLLSGGIDSGLLLGLMRLYGKDWPTFTVGYGQSFKDDELTDAAETARIFEAQNSVVRLDRDAFERALPRVVSVLEEPVASSSIVPMYFVAQRARQDVKVALMGQGPDELFGGYTRHLGVRYGGTFRSLPHWMRSALSAGIDRLPRNEALKRAAHSLATEDRLERYQNVFSLLPGASVDALFHQGALPGDAGAAALECWAPLRPSLERLDELNGFQMVELRSSLPDELLMYGDKLSMTHSLEVRVPYLDREIVEYVQQLDASFKVRNGTRKWLHRRVCRNFLPDTILRRKKRGFAVNVVDDWFHAAVGGRMMDYIADDQSHIYRLLDPRAIRRLLAEHRSGRHDHHKVLFSVVVLEQWLRCAGTSVPSPLHSAAA
ncbi:MAG TPA: asparagine synthase (glutamine-hydrolyzing) [Opitutaceae bacterium]|nr:asparagine synthase (glutamine-hydrolyzing) [Opitutaceae bacterium]